MDIAAMNVRVTFQKNETVTDKYGNHKNAWTDYFKCYATIGGETGQEQAVVGETVENTDMNVTVRYCTETAVITSTKYRILFGDDIYDILAVDHLNYKKNALKFKCRKVRRS
ncbi:phage head closure protein [Enterocloster clostridioformis]|uniref:phage head closure protein n=1 Tax=Enterocloster clostridioformis TaxID=1531 RepID=UPI0018A8B2BE|nr:phage head closure protein [Enterocloster clostridioformis]MDB2127473.1 phage head closure protein [Enterocloster clostridioformis]